MSTGVERVNFFTGQTLKINKIVPEFPSLSPSLAPMAQSFVGVKSFKEGHCDAVSCRATFGVGRLCVLCGQFW